MSDQESTGPRRGFSGLQVMFIVLATILVTVGVSYGLYRFYLNPPAFQPVELSAQEQQGLDSKLRRLGLDPQDLLPHARRENEVDPKGRLVPEKYEEHAEKRDIHMSERELNAIVASNPDLARRFAIDLSDDLASAKMLIPVDPEFPVMGGKTLRVNAGIEITYRDDRPVVKLRGISVMGVPLPNAWLGNLKNVDLVEQFGNDPGFWNSFSAGVQLIAIEQGQLRIKLKE